MITRLQEKYEKEVKNVLAKEFGTKNTFAIPKVKKLLLI